MASSDREAAEAAITANALVQDWRARLLRICCLSAGTALLLGTAIVDTLAGARVVPEAVIAIGIATLALPWVGPNTSTTKSLVFIALLTIALGLFSQRVGWAPGNVGLSCFLLTATGLLLDRRVGYGFLAIEGVAIWLTGDLVEAGSFSINETSLDPAVFLHWVRVAAVFVVVGGSLYVLLRSTSVLVGQAYADASSHLSQAQAQREASRRMRDARLDAERGLRQGQKLQAVGQLAGGLAHLLNNELTVIAGALDDLTRDRSLETRRDVAKTIEGSVSRAAATLRQLLIFSRREEPRSRSVELEREVSKIVQELRPTIQSDVVLEVRGDPQLVVVLDPSRLRLLVVNLLLNAVDAQPTGGRVRLTIRADADHDVDNTATSQVVLIVEDAGHGMTRDVADRACDTFFTTKDRERHAGLGLSIAAGIAEQSGGLLSIESAVGVGTRVQVRWPGARHGVTFADGDLPDVSLLHPATLSSKPSTPSVEVSPTLTDLPPVDSDRWKRDMAIRLARNTAMILAPTAIAMRAFTPDAPARFTLLIATASVAQAIAGWAPRVSHIARLWLMFGSMVVACGALLTEVGFGGPGLIVAMLFVVAWSAMLGARWAAPAALGYFALSMIVAGAFYRTGTAVSELGVTSMATAKNWHRVALILPLTQLGLLSSVWSIVDHAVAGIRSMTSARMHLLRAQRTEDEEGERALLFEEQATRVERMSVNGTAAGTIAHDLNNTLQSFSLAALLADEHLTPAETDDIARNLKLSSAHCEALVRLVGRDSTTATNAPPIDMGELLTQVGELLPLLLGNSVQLSITVVPGAYVAISEADLQRVLFNLATNARDAMARSGQLDVRLSRDATQVVLEVADNGAGIDGSTRERLFEPFFTTKAAGEGTGLGLHAVARIVEETAGTIECESQLGLGTTFRLRWPTADASASSAQSIHAPPSPHAAGKVLVAEDDALVRRVIVRALRLAHYEVHEVEDGDRAMALIDREGDWVAMCIDGVMPGRPSADVIEAFTTRFPGRPVLLCSGHLPDALENRGLIGGNVAFLAKPFTPSDLQRALATAIADSDS